jgi:hypothetical protein
MTINDILMGTSLLTTGLSPGQYTAECASCFGKFFTAKAAETIEKDQFDSLYDSSPHPHLGSGVLTMGGDEWASIAKLATQRAATGKVMTKIYHAHPPGGSTACADTTTS